MSSSTDNKSPPAAASTDTDADPAPPSNDLVFRDGFPALSRPDGKGPILDDDDKDPLPRFPFASYTDAVDIPEACRSVILEDCSRVFSARTRDDDAAYSAGCTYFVPCQMKPRCALEALALEIFRVHTKGIEGMYKPEESGAEWWTLVMEAADDDNQEKDDDDVDEVEEDNNGDEVGMHFDADYGLEAQVPNLLLHPRVATVTYLSNVGAPTLVLDKSSPPPSDTEKKSLSGSIKKGWLSGPQFGKHAFFDGRLLHGAPALFFPGNSGVRPASEPAAKRPKMEEPAQPEQRVTFLVNVWLNHCPLDAELLDDEVLEELKTPWQIPADESSGNEKSDKSYQAPFAWNRNVKLSEPDSTEKVRLETKKENPAGSDEVVICNHLVTVSFGASMKDLHAAASETAGGTSVELEFSGESLSLEVGAEVEEEDDELEEAGEQEDD